MSRFIILFFIFQPFSFLSAQKVDGIWKGKLTQAPGGCFPEYNIELHIKIEGTRVTGSSYHFSDLSNYVREEFEGGYDGINQSISIAETKMVTFNVPVDCLPCIKRYILIYSKNEKDETLSGDWGGSILGNTRSCPPGKVLLTRANESAFKQEEIKTPSHYKLISRENELVKEIRVDTGTIRLDFYDNGIIDGDTITVFVNNRPIVVNRMLTAKPITAFIRVDMRSPMQEVVMVAENLGTIPPNTALMIITAGNKRYKLLLSSSEQKSAMVRFRYEKP
jgi:hypothetical protein